MVEIRVSSAYINARLEVQRFRKLVGNSPIEQEIAWFPNANAFAGIVKAGEDEIAAHAAGVLGKIEDWRSATDMLHIFRPQDGGTAGGALGLSRSQSEELAPKAKVVSFALERYADNLIADLLKNNTPLVGSKLRTAGQAMGFCGFILRDSGNKTGRDEIAEVDLTFKNGTPTPTDPYLYLLDLDRTIPVESSRYDKIGNRLSLILP